MAPDSGGRFAPHISPLFSCAAQFCEAQTMPTVLRSGPYRLYFYSHEPNESPHVHVDRDDLSGSSGSTRSH